MPPYTTINVPAGERIRVADASGAAAAARYATTEPATAGAERHAGFRMNNVPGFDN